MSSNKWIYFSASGDRRVIYQCHIEFTKQRQILKPKEREGESSLWFCLPPLSLSLSPPSLRLSGQWIKDEIIGNQRGRLLSLSLLSLSLCCIDNPCASGREERRADQWQRAGRQPAQGFGLSLPSLVFSSYLPYNHVILWVKGFETVRIIWHCIPCVDWRNNLKSWTTWSDFRIMFSFKERARRDY